jgi:hypothetical protein
MSAPAAAPGTKGGVPSRRGSHLPQHGNQPEGHGRDGPKPEPQAFAQYAPSSRNARRRKRRLTSGVAGAGRAPATAALF